MMENSELIQPAGEGSSLFEAHAMSFSSGQKAWSGAPSKEGEVTFFWRRMSDYALRAAALRSSKICYLDQLN